MDASVDALGGYERQTTRFFGKHRGRVSNNADPSNRGRLKATVHEVLRDQETGWAEAALPYAGTGVGSYSIPAVGAGVWIEFEAGDVSRPIWTGCWWGRDEVPKDETGRSATPDLKILRSETGLMVALADDGETIAVSDAEGTNLLKIRAQEGKITLQAGTKVVVEAPLIELVKGARHPLVFGDDLLRYLNQLVQLFNGHTHPGELAAGIIPVTPAIPMPPFPPALPSLLSVRVKNG